MNAAAADEVLDALAALEGAALLIDGGGLDGMDSDSLERFATALLDRCDAARTAVWGCGPDDDEEYEQWAGRADDLRRLGVALAELQEAGFGISRPAVVS